MVHRASNPFSTRSGSTSYHLHNKTAPHGGPRRTVIAVLLACFLAVAVYVAKTQYTHPIVDLGEADSVDEPQRTNGGLRGTGPMKLSATDEGSPKGVKADHIPTREEEQIHEEKVLEQEREEHKKLRPEDKDYNKLTPDDVASNSLIGAAKNRVKRKNNKQEPGLGHVFGRAETEEDTTEALKKKPTDSGPGVKLLANKAPKEPNMKEAKKIEVEIAEKILEDKVTKAASH